MIPASKEKGEFEHFSFSTKLFFIRVPQSLTSLTLTALPFQTLLTDGASAEAHDDNFEVISVCLLIPPAHRH